LLLDERSSSTKRLNRHERAWNQHFSCPCGKTWRKSHQGKEAG
jgi:hypothetical protein